MPRYNVSLTRTLVLSADVAVRARMKKRHRHELRS